MSSRAMYTPTTGTTSPAAAAMPTSRQRTAPLTDGIAATPQPRLKPLVRG